MFEGFPALGINDQGFLYDVKYRSCGEANFTTVIGANNVMGHASSVILAAWFRFIMCGFCMRGRGLLP
jgi:hypothetical protein